MREEMRRIAGVVEAVKRLEQVLAREPCVPLRPLNTRNLLLDSLSIAVSRPGFDGDGPDACFGPERG
jgi:hypothetical protein